MKTLKGPAIFLAQFMADEDPFDNIESMAKWAANLGFVGIQVPIGNPAFIDVAKAAESKDYCDELSGRVRDCGVEITELSTHLEGQLVAVHPTYDRLFDGFAPAHLHGKPAERTAWAIEQVKLAAKASRNLGLDSHVTFSGALLWPMMYPWPQRPAGLVDTGFAELAARWRPILDVFEDSGVDCCYEIHPGEDLHDGVTFERFLAEVDGHPRANILYDPSHFILQQLDYLAFIDIYHERIKMFHVKDAEFNANGRAGVYGGYQDWVDRPGRFRSLGDGQIDFRSIFSWKCFARASTTSTSRLGRAGVGVLQRGDFLTLSKHQEYSTAPAKVRTVAVVHPRAHHPRPVTDKAFDDFAIARRAAGLPLVPRTTSRTLVAWRTGVAEDFLAWVNRIRFSAEIVSAILARAVSCWSRLTKPRGTWNEATLTRRGTAPHRRFPESSAGLRCSSFGRLHAFERWWRDGPRCDGRHAVGFGSTTRPMRQRHELSLAARLVGEDVSASHA